MDHGSLGQTLCRLARFGANIADAYSCFIFVPTHILNPNSNTENLKIGGYHSLGNDVIENCSLDAKSGLIGWVAEHQQTIHVSPFEHDSRTLGIYKTDQSLKSFLGIPICGIKAKERINRAVLACDSKKTFAFSKLQGKLLEDLAVEISATINLYFKDEIAHTKEDSWSSFIDKASRLLEALGKSSLEVLRAKLTNFDEIEQKCGTEIASRIVKQKLRLIEQALPPHFPSYILPNSEVIIVMDRMMSSFYENKFRALGNHQKHIGMDLCYEFKKASFRDKKLRSSSIEELILLSAFSCEELKATGTKGALYEYCRN